MADAQWQKVREIFDSALRHKPDERRRFVKEVCGDDKTLLVEVESLLSSHDSAESFMETPAVAKVAAAIEAKTKRLEAGKSFGHYEIIEQIGEGGMGEVYVANDKKLDRKVAIKLLNKEFSQDKSSLQRFVSEAKAASALNHPNILTIYEFGEAEDVRFIVSEYIEGKTLREIIRESRLTLPEILDISIQITGALSAAHKAHLVHRDIKPENIMIRPDGYVKVLDFGLAKLVEQKNKSILSSEEPTVRHNLTAKGAVVGTVNYMSPEQAKGEQVDERTDIFSLGVLIYEVLAGKPPFAGSNAIETMGSILNKDPVPLSRLTPDVPQELERITNKALRKDREERYQTAKDLLIDLKDVRQNLEFQNKLERTSAPVREEAQTQVVNATTSDIAQHTTSSANYIVNSVKNHKRLTLLVCVALTIASIPLYFLFKRSPVLTEKDTILLADFVNTTGDTVFDLTLKQALAVQLGQTPFLNIYPDDRIQETLRLMNRKPDERITKEVAREICERNGIKAILLGSIASLGNNYVITLEALNARTGEALAREQIEAAGKEEILGKLGEAATKLRGKLGETLQTIEKFDASVEQATTSSLEALKAFSIGQHLQKIGKPNESIAFHKRAVELDPNFASAYKNLGEAYFFTGQRDRAAEPFTKAFELRERVSEPEKFNITARYYQHVVGDVDKTLETLQLWKQTYPRQWNPRFDLASYYNDVGQHEKAVEEAQEAIRLNLHGLLPYSQLANAFLKLNRFEEAKAALEEGLSRGQSNLVPSPLIYRIAFIQGDRARMQQQIDGARGKPDEERMQYEEARVAMFNGQVSRAKQSFQSRIELAKQRDAKDAMSQTHAEFAIWNSFFGNCKESSKSIADAFAISRGEQSLNLSGIALAVCGDIDQAQFIASEFANRKSRDVTSISVLPEMRAAIEISRNNPAKAVEILESTRILERGFGIPVCSTYLRGIAYLRQKAGTEAMNEFQKILDRRGQFDTSPFFPLSHLGLARAAAIAGDATKSRKAYQDFFALWKDAEADIPILIEAKREYEKLK